MHTNATIRKSLGERGFLEISTKLYSLPAQYISRWSRNGFMVTLIESSDPPQLYIDAEEIEIASLGFINPNTRQETEGV